MKTRAKSASHGWTNYGRDLPREAGSGCRSARRGAARARHALRREPAARADDRRRKRRGRGDPHVCRARATAPARELRPRDAGEDGSGGARSEDGRQGERRAVQPQRQVARKTPQLVEEADLHVRHAAFKPSIVPGPGPRGGDY
ncbi:MAG: hypothetical protein E6H75_00750 [Betaproteobacteria bacterium]|nr:MAG: hypothetical protein E6H80_00870 [Betaproteobacteria bacterium]TMG79517.1 MAG: hypothetical protein E6H75_00750 [Betaproteobacteria bacterium]